MGITEKIGLGPFEAREDWVSAHAIGTAYAPA
jgi:hypothetical protein